MGEIFIIMLAVVLSEHFLFSKFLGVYPFITVSKKPSSALAAGAASAVVITAAMALAWLVSSFVWAHPYFRTAVFILATAGLVKLTDISLRKYAPGPHRDFALPGLLTLVNSAVLSAVLITAGDGYGLIRDIIYGALAAGGFTAAVAVLESVRDKMRFANPPKILKGIPIALAAAGLAAMAFAGLIGINIL